MKPCKMRLFRLAAFLCGLSVLRLTAYAAASEQEVVTTFPPLAGLVLMLDDQARISCLLPPGADPHHLQLTPKRLDQMLHAKLLLRSSRDDSGWNLPMAVEHTLDLWPYQETPHGHNWLVPSQVQAVLPILAEQLIRLHPERSEHIRHNLELSQKAVHEIEQQFRLLLTAVKSHGCIVQHPSWVPLLQQMDIPVLAVLEAERHGHEQGPHSLETALASLKAHPQAWLIGEKSHSNRALEWLAAHALGKVRLVYLDAMGSCGMRWDELMRTNLDRLR